MDATGGIERMIKAAKASGSLNISNRGLTYVLAQTHCALTLARSEWHWPLSAMVDDNYDCLYCTSVRIFHSSL